MPDEVSTIGVRLTLDASTFNEGLGAAKSGLTEFQQQAAQAGAGVGGLKAGTKSGSKAPGSAMPVDVTLSVSAESLAGLRKQVTSALQGIPVTLAVGKQATVAPAAATMSASTGMTRQQSEVAVKRTMDRNYGSSWGGAATWNAPRLALGGPVRANRPIIVGDGGRPEVFVPKTPGIIEPSIRDFYRKQEQTRRFEVELAAVDASRQRQHETRIHAMAGRRVRPPGYNFRVSPAETDYGGEMFIVRARTKGSRPETIGETYVARADQRGGQMTGPYMPYSTQVDRAHQRRGVAGWMYRAAERYLGEPLIPGHYQTPMAEGLWGDPERPFGGELPPFVPRGQMGMFYKPQRPRRAMAGLAGVGPAETALMSDSRQIARHMTEREAIRTQGIYDFLNSMSTEELTAYKGTVNDSYHRSLLWRERHGQRSRNRGLNSEQDLILGLGRREPRAEQTLYRRLVKSVRKSEPEAVDLGIRREVSAAAAEAFSDPVLRAAMSRVDMPVPPVYVMKSKYNAWPGDDTPTAEWINRFINVYHNPSGLTGAGTASPWKPGVSTVQGGYPGVLRHEVGHGVEQYAAGGFGAPDGWRKLWVRYAREMRKNTGTRSPSGVWFPNPRKRDISFYSYIENEREGFAEAFALSQQGGYHGADLSTSGKGLMAYMERLVGSQGHRQGGGLAHAASGVLQAKALEARALKVFGRTDLLSEAGYIAPSGKFIDFSGRSQASGYKREGEFYVPSGSRLGGEDWLAGQRNMDHREANAILPGVHDYDVIGKMLSSGFIRSFHMGESDWMGHIGMPVNQQQMSALMRAARSEGGPRVSGLIDVDDYTLGGLGRNLGFIGETDFDAPPLMLGRAIQKANALFGRMAGGIAHAAKGVAPWDSLVSRSNTAMVRRPVMAHGYELQPRDLNAVIRSLDAMSQLAALNPTGIPQAGGRMWYPGRRRALLEEARAHGNLDYSSKAKFLRSAKKAVDIPAIASPGMNDLYVPEWSASIMSALKDPRLVAGLQKEKIDPEEFLKSMQKRTGLAPGRGYRDLIKALKVGADMDTAANVLADSAKVGPFRRTVRGAHELVQDSHFIDAGGFPWLSMGQQRSGLPYLGSLHPDMPFKLNKDGKLVPAQTTLEDRVGSMGKKGPTYERAISLEAARRVHAMYKDIWPLIEQWQAGLWIEHFPRGAKPAPYETSVARIAVPRLELPNIPPGWSAQPGSRILTPPGGWNQKFSAQPYRQGGGFVDMMHGAEPIIGWQMAEEQMRHRREAQHRQGGGDVLRLSTPEPGWEPDISGALRKFVKERPEHGNAILSAARRVHSLAPRVTDSLYLDVAEYPHGDATAFWDRPRGTINFTPEGLRLNSAEGLHGTTLHEHGHAIRDYMASPASGAQDALLAKRKAFDLLTLQGAPISAYSISRMWDLRQQGYRPWESLQSALHENFADTFEALGSRSALTPYDLGMSGSGGAWFGIEDYEALQENMREFYGTDRYRVQSALGDYDTPLGSWPGRPGRALERPAQLKRAMASMLRALPRAGGGAARGGLLDRLMSARIQSAMDTGAIEESQALQQRLESLRGGWGDPRKPDEPAWVRWTRENKAGKDLTGRAGGGDVVGRPRLAMDFAGAPLGMAPPRDMMMQLGPEGHAASLWKFLMDPKNAESFSYKAMRRVLPAVYGEAGTPVPAWYAQNWGEGMPYPGRARKMQGGGPGSLEGLYVVGEIGKELFVPNSLAHMIPKKVMDQIPKAAGGMQVIGTRRDHALGGELFAPPEDGVIIPNRLMDQVPRAAGGVRPGGWRANQGSGAIDSMVSAITDMFWNRTSFGGGAWQRRGPGGRFGGAGADQVHSSLDSIQRFAPRQRLEGPQPVEGWWNALPVARTERLSGVNLTLAERLGGRGSRSLMNRLNTPEPVETLLNEYDEGNILASRTRLKPTNQMHPPVSPITAGGWPQGAQPSIRTQAVNITTGPNPTITTTGPNPIMAGPPPQGRPPQQGQPPRQGPPVAGPPPTPRVPAAQAIPEEMRDMLAELRQGQAFSAQMMAARTPRGMAAVFGSALLGGRAGGLQQIAQERMAASRFERAAVQLGRPDEIKRYQNMLDRLAVSRGTEADKVKLEIEQYKNLDVAHKELADSHDNLLGVIEKGRPGMVAQLRNFGSIIVGVQAYSLAMQGVGAVMDAAVPAAGSIIDSWRGWAAVSNQTTGELAKQIDQSKGNVVAVMNQYEIANRLGAELGTTITEALTVPAAVKAGAIAGANVETAVKSAAGTFGGGTPAGTYRGSTGPFESWLLAADKGAMETLAGALESAMSVKDFSEVIAPRPNVNARFQDIWATEMGHPEYAARSADRFSGEAEWVQRAQATKDLLALSNAATDRAESRFGSDVAEVEWEFVGKDAAWAFAKTFKEETGRALPLGVRDWVERGVVPRVEGELPTTTAQADWAAVTTAAGMGLLDPASYAKEVARQMSGQEWGAGQLMRRQLSIEQPYAIWQQLAQNPLIRPSAGMTTLGVSPGVQQQAQSSIAATRSSQGFLTAYANAGVQAQRAEIDRMYPWQETPVIKASGKTEIMGMGEAFSYATGQAQKLSGNIADLTAEMMDTQRAASDVSYANQIRIAYRSLGDAVGMLGKVGGTRLGYLQREEWLTSRASQSLGLASQRIGLIAQGLSLALQARSIATNLAVAQFQAPGETGEERYARQREAIIRAGIERRQLGLSQQQYGISQQQLPLAQQQFVTAGKIWSENAQRAAVDAKRAIVVMQSARDAEIFALGAQKEVAGAQQKMGVWLSQAATFAARAERKQTSAIESVVSGFLEAGNAVTEFRDAVYEALNISLEKKNNKASGFIGTVSAATDMTVGEAGAETVAILRNPRKGTLNMGGGGGPMNLTVNINNPSVRNDRDIHSLARMVAAEVERSLGRKGEMLGLRQPAV